MEKVIIIGSTGYLGRNLYEYLTIKGYEVHPCDIHEDNPHNQSNYTQLNINDSEAVRSLDLNVQYIYMFAGLTGTDQGFVEYKKFVTTNELGLLNLLNAIKDSDFRPKVMFPSTRLVYKGSSDALHERSCLEPKTIYAVNKIACENLLQIYKNVFSIEFMVFRICVPYGNIKPGEYSYGTIGNFIRRAKEGQNIVLYGDGNLRRTFTHVQDLFDKIFMASNTNGCQEAIFNVGGETFTLKSVAQMIANKYGVSLTFSDWPQMQHLLETGDTVFDGSLLDSFTYVGSKMSLEQLIDNL